MGKKRLSKNINIFQELSQTAISLVDHPCRLRLVIWIPRGERLLSFIKTESGMFLCHFIDNVKTEKSESDDIAGMNTKPGR